jgi:hypothetical protein
MRESIGKQHSNPLLDSRAYNCELGDGTVYRRYSASVIAENIFAQCNGEGRRQAVLQKIPTTGKMRQLSTLPMDI